LTETAAIQIDALYAAVVDSLPASLRRTARELPYLLKLAPSPELRFSEVFSHDVTLGAPLLVGEGFPQISPAIARGALLAHLLAVIEAFGTDRLADAQVEATREVSEVLEHLRQTRNRELDRLWPGASREAVAADARTRAAIARERALLARVSVVDFETYAEISLSKQAVGFPASLALARAAGADAQQLRHIERALTGVWLGLQFEDDVADWEKDWTEGGAWAVCLALGLRSVAPRDNQATRPDLVRKAVLGTGALRRMLEHARRRYRTTWRHARAIGAHRLAAWANERDKRLQSLIPLEAKHAGYAVRIGNLAPWAAEVLG
jgi:hypothetical protein